MQSSSTNRHQPTENVRSSFGKFVRRKEIICASKAIPFWSEIKWQSDNQVPPTSNWRWKWQRSSWFGPRIDIQLDLKILISSKSKDCLLKMFLYTLVSWLVLHVLSVHNLNQNFCLFFQSKKVCSKMSKSEEKDASLWQNHSSRWKHEATLYADPYKQTIRLNVINPLIRTLYLKPNTHNLDLFNFT